MDPVTFPEQTGTLGKPPGMQDKDCGSLPVYRDGINCVSCWELSDADIEALLKTRRLYLLLISGQTQPPCLITTSFPRGSLMTRAQLGQ